MLLRRVVTSTLLIVLLLWNLFWGPLPQSNGGFQAVGETANVALDTKTGGLCRRVGAYPVPPLCSELKWLAECYQLLPVTSKTWHSVAPRDTFKMQKAQNNYGYCHIRWALE